MYCEPPCLEEPSRRRRRRRRCRRMRSAVERGRMFLSGHCACVRLVRGQGRLLARRRFCEKNNNNAEYYEKNNVTTKNKIGLAVVARRWRGIFLGPLRFPLRTGRVFPYADRAPDVYIRTPWTATAACIAYANQLATICLLAHNQNRPAPILQYIVDIFIFDYDPTLSRGRWTTTICIFIIYI